MKLGKWRRGLLFSQRSDPILPNDVLTLDGVRNTRAGHDANAAVWEDLSGNGLDFTGTNPLWGENCAVFDATPRMFARSADLQSGGALTIELVFKTTGKGAKGTNSEWYGWIFGNTDGFAKKSGRFRLYSYTDNSAWGLSSSYGDSSMGYTSTGRDTARYAAFVLSGTQVTRYLDGTLYNVSSNPAALSYPAQAKGLNWCVGAVGELDAAFHGAIYRVGVSSHAMTAEEIAARYRVFRQRFGMS